MPKVNEKSIAEIEARIEEIKSSRDAKTKSSQAEIKRLKTALSKTYIEHKRKVLSLEEGNSSRIIFLRSTMGFYELFEKSLLFYAFDIAPKLNMEVNIYSDGDYELELKNA